MDENLHLSTILILKKLISGQIERRIASEWAMKYLLQDNLLLDSQLYDVISAIGAVDLPSTDRDYLYQINDFKEWLKELER